MSYFSRFIHHTEVIGGVGLDWGNWIVVAIWNVLQTIFFSRKLTSKLGLTGVTKKGRIDAAMPRHVHTNAFPWTLQGKGSWEILLYRYACMHVKCLENVCVFA